MAPDPRSILQSLCEAGQEALMRMNYLQAQDHLARAEALAWEAGDWDTLSRLYMPLQEARRQIRQRCGEGTVAAIVATAPGDMLDPARIVERYPSGQLLVAGFDSIAPAMAIRCLAHEQNLYLECFLAAVQQGALVVYPLPDHANSGLQIHSDTFPPGPAPGDTATYAKVMALWETLHLSFLRSADSETDLLKKAHGYRVAIAVDYACELAHQKLSDVARQLARTRRSS